LLDKLPSGVFGYRAYKALVSRVIPKSYYVTVTVIRFLNEIVGQVLWYLLSLLL